MENVAFAVCPGKGDKKTTGGRSGLFRENVRQRTVAAETVRYRHRCVDNLYLPGRRFFKPAFTVSVRLGFQIHEFVIGHRSRSVMLLLVIMTKVVFA